MDLEVRLSEVDRLLLKLLEQDSRRTASEMASIAGISLQAVQNRIERLRELGVIERFTIKINPAAIKPLTELRVM